METKKLIFYGLLFSALPSLVNLGIFVTFPQMTAYAVSKDSFTVVCEQIKVIQADVKDIKVYLMEK